MNNKQFDAVLFMRQQRDILSKKLSEMSSKEIIAHFKNASTKNSVQPSTK